MRVELRPGYLYVFKARKPDRILRLYGDLVRNGNNVLCVTRLHPDQLKEDFGIPQEKVLWLSNSVGTRNVNPQNVGILTDTLIRYFENGPNSVVILDGLEYLVMQNDFGKVLRFVNYLYESVAVTKGTLVTTVDPRAFSTQELAFLEKNSVTVDEQDEVWTVSPPSDT
jgi:two-component system cell cycle response regulator